MTQEHRADEDRQAGFRSVIEQYSAKTLAHEAQRISEFEASVERAKIYFSLKELQKRFGAAAVREVMDELSSVSDVII